MERFIRKNKYLVVFPHKKSKLYKSLRDIEGEISVAASTISKKLKEMGVEDTLINLKGMTQGMLVVLGEQNITKLKDFAELSSDELIGGMDEIKGKRIKINGYLEDFALTREEADNMIMDARKIVFGN